MPSFESTTIHLAQQTQDVCPLVQDLLPLYVEDEVSPSSREVIAAHLSNCEYCRGYLAGARSVQAQLRRETSQRQSAVAARPVEQQVVGQWQQFLRGVAVLLFYFVAAFGGLAIAHGFAVGVGEAVLFGTLVTGVMVGLLAWIAKMNAVFTPLRLLLLLSGCLLGGLGFSVIYGPWHRIEGTLAAAGGLAQVWVAVMIWGSGPKLFSLPHTKGQHLHQTSVLWSRVAILILGCAVLLIWGVLLGSMDVSSFLLFNAGLVLLIGVVVLFIGLLRRFGPFTPTRLLLLLIGFVLCVLGIVLFNDHWKQMQGLLIGLIGFASILMAVAHRPRVAAGGSPANDKP